MKTRTRKPNILGIFRGLDLPFQGDRLRLYSPLNGIQTTMVKNMRMHGHFGEEKHAKYPIPERRFPDALHPQDATAWLLVRLFPNCTGLYANDHSKDMINEYLTPQNIAKIFIILDKLKQNKTNIEDKAFVCKGYNMNAAEKEIFYLLLTCHKSGTKVIENIAKNPTATQKKYENIIETAYEHARLLTESYKESIPENAEVSGYPVHAFFRIVLKYMWEKYKWDKENFKPYIEAFRAAKIIDDNCCQQISWHGDDSIFTDSEFQSDDFMPAKTPYEEMIFDFIRKQYFQADFPPVIDFGKSFYLLEKRHIKKPNKKKPDSDEHLVEGYSDCGETMIRNLFNFLLYDNEKDLFDVSRLHKLKDMGYAVSDKLIDYYTYICTNRETMDSEEARIKWSNVIGYMNDANDILKIIYMHPRQDDAYMGLRQGMDNIMITLMKLLGLHRHRPKDCHFVVDMKTKADCWNNLGIFIKLINSTVSNSDDKSILKFMIFDFSESHARPEYEDLREAIPEDGWYGFSILLQFPESQHCGNSYLLTFDEHHFDFAEKKPLNDFKPEFDMLSTERYPDYAMFSLPLDTTTGRLTMLNYFNGMKEVKTSFQNLIRIIDFTTLPEHTEEEVKTVSAKVDSIGEKTLKSMLYKWLQRDGMYFASWQNEEINRSVVTALRFHMSVEEILALDIPPLTSPLLLELFARGDLDMIDMVLEYDLHRYDRSSNALKLSFDHLDDVELSILVCPASATYAKKILNLTLLQCLANSNNTKVSHPLSELGMDIKEEPDNGFMPLYYAVNNGNKHMVRYLLSQGSRTDRLTPDMKSALDVALEKLIYITNIMRSQLTEFQHGVTPITNYNKTIDQLIKIIEILIIHGCDVSRTAENLQLLQNNLGAISSYLGEDAFSRHQAVVEMIWTLISPDKPVANKFGFTPLHYAVINGKLDRACFWVEHGVDVNAQTNEGDTVLHLACKTKNDDIVEYLLTCGIDTDIVNNKGDLPEDCARRCKDNSTASIIIEHLLDKMIERLKPPPPQPGIFDNRSIEATRRYTAAMLLHIYCLRYHNVQESPTPEGREALRSAYNKLQEYLDCLQQSPLKELVNRIRVPGLSLQVNKHSARIIKPNNN